MIDRRELLERAALILGGAVSASAAAGFLSGCAGTPPAADGASAGQPARRFFTASELKTVSATCEQIIPKTDTPGAIDLGVPAFCDRMMTGFYQEHERGIVRTGLAQMDKDARAAHGKAFAELAPDQQVALMKIYDREAYETRQKNRGKAKADPHFFAILKEQTTLGFFSTQYAATKILKYESVPGPYKGDIPLSKVGGVWAI